MAHKILRKAIVGGTGGHQCISHLLVPPSRRIKLVILEVLYTGMAGFHEHLFEVPPRPALIAQIAHSYPAAVWIRTTNGLERINKELKRRSRVIGAFPSDESFMRLSISILIDINERVDDD